MSAVFTGFLNTFHYLGQRYDDDYIDRLHYFMTSNVLLSLSVLVSWKQFGGKPMECLVPDMFTGAWEQYAENFCWAQDTYHVPFTESVPTDVEQKEQQRISYYQWVPFFLLLEAACFRLPSLFWKCLASHSGIKIHDVLKMATDPENVKADTKNANVKGLTVHLQNALKFQRRLYKRNVRPHRILRVLNLPYSAVYVTTLYLTVKICYLSNVLLQLYILNKFLDTGKYSLYGFGALSDILSGVTWDSSGVFPRVTLCDFKVRVMGNNIQQYSVQCVLIINIFNEKIFVFLWFWYMLLAALTAASLVYWLLVILLPGPSRWFISRHLELSEMPFNPNSSKKDVDRFVSSYLRSDGVFVIRMITMHAGIIFGTELVVALWRAFYGIEESYRRQSSTDKLVEMGVATPSPKIDSCQSKFSSCQSKDGSQSKHDKNNPFSYEKGYNKKPFSLRLRPFSSAKNCSKKTPDSPGKLEDGLMEILLPDGDTTTYFRQAPPLYATGGGQSATLLTIPSTVSPTIPTPIPNMYSHQPTHKHSTVRFTADTPSPGLTEERGTADEEGAASS